MVPNKTLETPNYRLERLKHDDPRLDHIEASYKLAEEVQDPTAVTRRSQEPTNKQTPVIKGVLTDAGPPAGAPTPPGKRSRAPAGRPAARSPGPRGWRSARAGLSDLAQERARLWHRASANARSGHDRPQRTPARWPQRRRPWPPWRAHTPRCRGPPIP